MTTRTTDKTETEHNLSLAEIHASLRDRVARALPRWGASDRDDVVQEVWLRVLQKRLTERLQGSDLRAVVCSLAYYAIHEAIRRKRRDRLRVEPSDVDHEPRCQRPGPEDELSRREVQAILIDSARRLGPDALAVLYLYAMEACSSREAGRRSNMRPDSVRKRWYRLRKRLCSELGPRLCA